MFCPRFGVEIEWLLEDWDISVGHNHIDGLWAEMMREGAYVLEAEGQRIFEVGMRIEGREVRFLSESVCNIVEMVFPPMQDLAEFRKLYVQAVPSFERALGKAGLRRFDGAIYSQPVREFQIRVKAADYARVAATVGDWEVAQNPIAHPLYWFSSASIHVHFETSLEEVFPLLPFLYEREIVAPLEFGAGGSFLGVSGRSARNLAGFYSFPDSYSLGPWPKVLPKGMAEYERMKVDCTGFFRDYALIALRPDLGTLEFRGNDTHYDLKRIVEMIEWRRVNVEEAKAGEVGFWLDWREAWLKNCS